MIFDQVQESLMILTDGVISHLNDMFLSHFQQVIRHFIQETPLKYTSSVVASANEDNTNPFQHLLFEVKAEVKDIFYRVTGKARAAGFTQSSKYNEK
mmetsp:Transcript_5517/g.8658  ORF Transcript_5517/g.8658 Transcript_5517/m.8658 type:complete len:97 (-) Transcript_5517:1859-2149(-)